MEHLALDLWIYNNNFKKIDIKFSEKNKYT